MKTIQPKPRGQQGSVLLIVMAYIFLSAILVGGMLTLSSAHRHAAFDQSNIENALDVAEGGIERSARYIEVNIGSMPTSLTSTGQVGQGTYQALITRINQVTYSIISTGTVSGKTRILYLKRIYQPTYAEFALWSHVNGAIYFIDGEEFFGHVHADDQLYFSSTGGGPIFHAECTSAASTYQGNISGCVFDKGLTMNSYQGTMADVDFNDGASYSLLKIAQTQNGLVLQGNSTITFNGATMKISNDRMSWTNHVYTPPAEGIIYVQTVTNGTSTTRAGRANLKGGTLTGRMTIVTEEDVYVQGSILYTTDPRSHTNSTDALGLISMDDVWVDTVAPNNLEIDGAIMATGQGSGTDGSVGSFGVINYNSGSSRGNLTIYGGVVQDQRGAVGTFNSSTGQTQTGFNKQYSYDPRFIDTPPPYYPAIAGKLEYSDWQELH